MAREQAVLILGDTMTPAALARFIAQRHPTVKRLDIHRDKRQGTVATLEGEREHILVLAKELEYAAEAVDQLQNLIPEEGELHWCVYCERERPGPWGYFTAVAHDGSKKQFPPVCKECAIKLQERYRESHPEEGDFLFQMDKSGGPVEMIGLDDLKGKSDSVDDNQ